MFKYSDTRTALDIKDRTVSCTDIMQYQLGKQLDFAPGSKYVYSNLGYCILGRVIEHVTGETYAEVRKKYLVVLMLKHVCAAAGICKGQHQTYTRPNPPKPRCC